jgi:hypothetical protein
MLRIPVIVFGAIVGWYALERANQNMPLFSGIMFRAAATIISILFNMIYPMTVLIVMTRRSVRNYYARSVLGA